MLDVCESDGGYDPYLMPMVARTRWPHQVLHALPFTSSSLRSFLILFLTPFLTLQSNSSATSNHSLFLSHVMSVHTHTSARPCGASWSHHSCAHILHNSLFFYLPSSVVQHSYRSGRHKCRILCQKSNSIPEAWAARRSCRRCKECNTECAGDGKGTAAARSGVPRVEGHGTSLKGVEQSNSAYTIDASATTYILICSIHSKNQLLLLSDTTF